MDLKNYYGYLDRAADLLQRQSQVSLTYAALELRKAIEFLIWTQFRETFARIITRQSGLTYYDFIEKTQDRSIKKMYKMLKKHCINYVENAQNKEVNIFKEGLGNAELQKVGSFSYIPPEFAKSYYSYLSIILHYEKDFYPNDFSIDQGELRKIYDELVWMKDNYTFHINPTKSEYDEIISDINELFGIEL